MKSLFFAALTPILLLSGFAANSKVLKAECESAEQMLRNRENLTIGQIGHWEGIQDYCRKYGPDESDEEFCAKFSKKKFNRELLTPAQLGQLDGQLFQCAKLNSRD